MAVDVLRKRVAAIAAAVAALALLLLLLAVLLQPAGSVQGLDGDVGVLDNRALWDEMDPLSGTIYRLGDVLCHQKEDRSLLLNGNQLAFCARDTGILLGFLGFALFLLRGQTPLPWWAIIVLLLPTALDGGLQAMGLHESSNALRLITGALTGMAVMLFLMKLMERSWEESVSEG